MADWHHALNGNIPYMKGVEIAGVSGMIAVLDGVIKTLLIVVTGNLFASPSLMLLVKNFDAQNPAHIMLAIVNVMTFWVLAIRAVGLARLASSSFGKAAAWVFGVWALQTGFFTGISLAVQKAFGN